MDVDGVAFVAIKVPRAERSQRPVYINNSMNTGTYRRNGVSDPRNKTLMTMFNLIGKGDKAGSGFDVFRDAAAYAGVGGPELVEYLEPDRTKLTLCVETDGSKLAGADGGTSDAIDAEADGGKAGGNGGKAGGNGGKAGGNGGKAGGNGGKDPAKKKSDVKDFATVEERILQLVQEQSTITVAEMAGALEISKRRTERLLASLKSQGKLVRIGAKRNGHWEVRE